LKKLMRIAMAAVLVVSLSSVGSFIATSTQSHDESMFMPGGGGSYTYTQYMIEVLGLFEEENF